MLITKTVKLKWNKRNKDYYINKGYNFTFLGDKFEINANDLTKGSHKEVVVKCDYCGNITKKTFQTYKIQHHSLYGDACKCCQPKKNKLCCMEKYGVDNGAKTQSAKDKTKATCMKKYGVENPAQTKESRDKIKKATKANAKERLAKSRQTTKQRYGEEHPFSNKEIMQKAKDTLYQKYGVRHPKQSEIIKERERKHNQTKYGVDYYLQTQECKDRIKQTNLKKYGYEHILQVPEIRKRGMENMLKNNKCATSKQQIQLKEILYKMYGNCELNKPCGFSFLDCVICVDSILIDVEYDGRYWHQDKQRDRKRDEFVKSQGYKILRIDAEKSLPTELQIIEAVEYLLQDKNNYTVIRLDI